MNAQQSQRLVKSARQALAMLNPEWPVTGELRAALDAATATATTRNGCVFCNKPKPTVEGFSKKGVARMAHEACAEAYRANAASFTEWLANYSREAVVNADNIDKLTNCACGGAPSDHREVDGNLLDCSHCDKCDHFHYDVDAQLTEAGEEQEAA